MLVREIMKAEVFSVTPDTKIVEVAKQMRDGDLGAVPVCEDDQVIGMITDRDITVRGVAEGLDIQNLSVREIMTDSALTCFEDQDAAEVTDLMHDRQVRRIPVVSRENKLVGIVSIGDLVQDQETSQVASVAMSEISAPTHREPGSTNAHH